jgi:NDP-sugar pyrophosphorylase family protein
VVSFPIVEYWLDIGQPADYIHAQADAGAAGVTP